MWKPILALVIWLCALALLEALAQIWPEAKIIQQFVGFVGSMILWFSDFFFLRFPDDWKDADSTDTRNQSTKPPCPKPPLGYRGPFWNKPSPAFLQSNARSFSEAQSRVVMLLLLLPFGALVFMLLH